MEHLNRYFEGIAWKYLTAVDADPASSNQHELGGLVKAGFRGFLGDPGIETLRFPCRFVYLATDDEKSMATQGQVSWYDSRRGRSHRGPELRLYYVSNSVTEQISAGMFCIIAKTVTDEVILVFCDQDSSQEAQLRWLFGLDDASRSFSGKKLLEGDQRDTWSMRWVMDLLGIELHEVQENYLDEMLARFNGVFPKTRDFSAFALEMCKDVDPLHDADDALVSLMNTEEMLFRQFEKHFVEQKLEEGFEDVDHFLSYSLSIQNRRKSRVGLALENHLEYIFKKNNILHVRGAMTENKSKPDFLFPGKDQYLDMTYPEAGLTMLGVKSTCKDRWRQVLAEAQRLQEKHLLTLEPGISTFQLDEVTSRQSQTSLSSLPRTIRNMSIISLQK